MRRVAIGPSSGSRWRPQAFEDDHERDLVLRRLGYAVHRFTDRQLAEQPHTLARALLGTMAVAPGQARLASAGAGLKLTV